MKLTDLGLKTKPATKYFEGGFIKFSTMDKELHFAVMVWTADRKVLCLTHQGWILQKMESLTKEIMTNSSVWHPEIIIKKIGEFTAFSEILANSGFESYGLKFQIKYPTLREYEHTTPKAEGWD